MRWFYVLILFLVLTKAVLAADSTFNIGLLVGSDTTPPSTPDNLVAIPISTSQIDLTWDVSVDNWIFGGYQIWRDAVQIATTTLNSYSDTGLTASTTYSYYIVAFDEALNYSTSSATVATTTLAVVATSTPTTTPETVADPSSSASKAPFLIRNLKIDTTETTANIGFDTSVYSKVLWRWGRTTNYELGYVASDIYRQKHSTQLNELDPGTVYELEIILTRRFSGETLTERVRFETKALPDINQPPNVSDLSAVVLNNGEVKLNWKNPDIADLSRIRVLSNDYFYPLDRLDGYLVYEGLDEGVNDERQLKQNRFYTVFVFDTAGNRSSGALLYIDETTGAVSLPSIEVVDKDPDLLYDPYVLFDFSKLELWQDGQRLPQYEGTFTIDRDSEVTFKIPYDTLPENLKTVIVTLVSPEDKTKHFSFLLTINADRSAYEASLSKLLTLGYYETTISIFDYGAQVVSKKSGGVIVGEKSFEDRAVRVIEEVKLLINWPLIFIIGLLLVLVFSWLIWRYVSRQ